MHLRHSFERRQWDFLDFPDIPDFPDFPDDAFEFTDGLDADFDPFTLGSITSTSDEVDVTKATARTPASLPLSTTLDTPAAATQGAGNKSPATIGGIVGGVAALVIILGIAIVMYMRRRAQKNRERRRRQRTQDFTVTALPQIMMAGPGNLSYPQRVVEKSRGLKHSGLPPMADDQRGGQADSEMLAKLNMIMESVARIEADRDREEEAPPDYRY
ncbi:hypothetical protein PQX77_019445 [Marasmius sp. AFHP31]|nr:hypothetical protein PQX77_019445 [Marasmius sp. AFHP31]